MAARKGVARLASLYGMMERMRSLELRVAAGAVDDVVCLAAIAATVRENQIADARAAMASGRREDWQVAQTTRGVIEARMVRIAERPITFDTFLDLNINSASELVGGVMVKKMAAQLAHEKLIAWLLTVVNAFVTHR